LDGGGSLEDRSSTITSTPVTAQGIEIDLFKFPNALADAQIPNSFPCGTSPFVVTGALGSFLAGAIGNIDGDATADMWTISSQNRRTSGCDADANVVAGEPANEQNDLQK
jgi:hypothetical protein